VGAIADGTSRLTKITAKDRAKPLITLPQND